MQCDLCCDRQAHPFAADQEPRPARDLTKARTRLDFLLEHDLSENRKSTFPDHALSAGRVSVSSEQFVEQPGIECTTTGVARIVVDGRAAIKTLRRRWRPRAHPTIAETGQWRRCHALMR